MNWWKRRRLRIAREKYSMWKARVEAMQRARTAPLGMYMDTVAQLAKYEERVESLMREQ